MIRISRKMEGPPSNSEQNSDWAPPYIKIEALSDEEGDDNASHDGKRLQHYAPENESSGTKTLLKKEKIEQLFPQDEADDDNDDDDDDDDGWIPCEENFHGVEGTAGRTPQTTKQGGIISGSFTQNLQNGEKSKVHLVLCKNGKYRLQRHSQIDWRQRKRQNGIGSTKGCTERSKRISSTESVIKTKASALNIVGLVLGGNGLHDESRSSRNMDQKAKESKGKQRKDVRLAKHHRIIGKIQNNEKASNSSPGKCHKEVQRVLDSAQTFWNAFMNRDVSSFTDGRNADGTSDGGSDLANELCPNNPDPNKVKDQTEASNSRFTIIDRKTTDGQVVCTNIKVEQEALGEVDVDKTMARDREIQDKVLAEANLQKSETIGNELETDSTKNLNHMNDQRKVISIAVHRVNATASVSPNVSVKQELDKPEDFNAVPNRKSAQSCLNTEEKSDHRAKVQVMCEKREDQTNLQSDANLDRVGQTYLKLIKNPKKRRANECISGDKSKRNFWKIAFKFPEKLSRSMNKEVKTEMDETNENITNADCSKAKLVTQHKDFVYCQKCFRFFLTEEAFEKSHKSHSDDLSNHPEASDHLEGTTAKKVKLNNAEISSNELSYLGNKVKIEMKKNLLQEKRIAGNEIKESVSENAKKDHSESKSEKISLKSDERKEVGSSIENGVAKNTVKGSLITKEGNSEISVDSRCQQKSGAKQNGKIQKAVSDKVMHDVNESDLPSSESDQDQKKKECFPCNICDKQYLFKESLNAHMDKHDGRMYKCDICGFRTHHRCSLLRHQANKGIHSSLVSCNKCDASFFTSWLLREHNWKKHGGLKPSPLPSVPKIEGQFKGHECRICLKVFKKLTDLQRHELIHSGEKPFACDVCGAKFNRKCARNEHMYVHRGLEEDERVQNIVAKVKCHVCAHCGKTYRRRTELNWHEKVVHKGMKIVCAKCGAKFANPKNLKIHEKIHRNPKTFKCLLCSHRSNCQSDLKKHLRTHTQERPYQCQLCKKAFKQSTLLTNHLKNVHREVRNPNIKNE